MIQNMDTVCVKLYEHELAYMHVCVFGLMRVSGDMKGQRIFLQRRAWYLIFCGDAQLLVSKPLLYVRIKTHLTQALATQYDAAVLGVSGVAFGC